MRTIRIRQLAHKHHLRLLESGKSVLAEYLIVEDHRIVFDKTEVFAKPRGYYFQYQGEAIKMQHPNKLNRDDCFKLSRMFFIVTFIENFNKLPSKLSKPNLI